MCDLDKDLRQIKLFQKMLQEAPAIEQEFQDFNLEYALLSERDDQLISRILKCHLLIEYYLDKYLAVANPAIQNWDKAKLSFYQKLELVIHPQTIFVMIEPGMRCINKLRNKTTHTIQLSFDEDELKPIKDFLDVWFGVLGKPVRSGVDLIEDFTLVCCAFINSYVSTINRYADNKGLVGLLEWRSDNLRNEG
jgi:hypothetical protein